MNVIDKVDFQNRISNLISHMDYYDQSMCRAALVGMMLAMMPQSALDVVLKSFAEYVQHYYSETPEVRKLKAVR